MRKGILALVLSALLAPPVSAVTIDWVDVGNAGNAADTDPATDNCGPSRNQGCGAVDYAYRIGKTEVTNGQYVEFLNAKASTTTVMTDRGLYNFQMTADAYGGITRSGVEGNYTYAAKPGFENKPVNFVNYNSALRFTNWLSNGQGSGDTETGGYTFLPNGQLVLGRNPGANNIYLTSDNEWYKAAYYDPISNAYFRNATGSNTPLSCVAPGSDNGSSANCMQFISIGPTVVGAYGLSSSPYGTFDQDGNVQEWVEEFSMPPPGTPNPYLQAGYRGAHFNIPGFTISSANWGTFDPNFRFGFLGFRVATIPEPATVLFVGAGLVGLALRGRKRG